jgi:hypothetical protein
VNSDDEISNFYQEVIQQLEDFEQTKNNKKDFGKIE